MVLTAIILTFSALMHSLIRNMQNGPVPPEFLRFLDALPSNDVEGKQRKNQSKVTKGDKTKEELDRTDICQKTNQGLEDH